MLNKSVNFVTCEKNHTRNIDEAPECPICKYGFGNNIDVGGEKKKGIIGGRTPRAWHCKFCGFIGNAVRRDRRGFCASCDKRFY